MYEETLKKLTKEKNEKKKKKPSVLKQIVYAVTFTSPFKRVNAKMTRTGSDSSWSDDSL